MYETFIQRFQVPPQAVPHLKLFFSPQDLWFGEAMTEEEFTAEEIGRLLASESAQKAGAGIAGWQTDVGAFIADGYRSGLLSVADKEKDLWKLNNFYGKLDLFAVSEKEMYDTLTMAQKHELDDWYFQDYYDGLDKSGKVRPSGDEIMLLDDVLAFIDRQDRPVYLNYCDCRSLTGECGLPTRTCITYRDGDNSFAARGISERIDKEKAKEIVRQADRDGLMHTVNPNGICNCCGDCCYLFRSRSKMNSGAFWPKSESIVSLDHEQCIGCTKCAQRCHFNALEVVKDGKKRSILVHPERCVGCGICATGCPVSAITMKGRE